MSVRNRLIRFALDTALLVIAGSFVATFLLHLTPGADLDARELNTQISGQTLDAIRQERRTAQSFSFLFQFLRGDFGNSIASGTPVSSLIVERSAPTIKTVAAGASLGLIVSVLLALGAAVRFPRATENVLSLGFLGLLSIPAGLLVLFAIFWRLPIIFAVAAAVAPRTWFYANRLFARERTSGYLLNAVAAGISPLRIAAVHLLPALRVEMAGLCGFALVTALGAAIPAEALSGQPGLGQLAWKSATERDLPVLLGVTMVFIVTARAVTLVSATRSDNESSKTALAA